MPDSFHSTVSVVLLYPAVAEIAELPPPITVGRSILPEDACHRENAIGPFHLASEQRRHYTQRITSSVQIPC
jgi:hypothetical protein